MAVVSLSRIQVRRGKKNEGSGLPQLASGELAWALDTQEVYIGNGSVAEGAPFVGNTKLLTEKDNILAFATSYEYKANTAYLLTGADLTSGVKRSLQDRLDDFVTVKSFGCLGDGTDQGDKLQRAIDQIFLNSASLLDLTARTTIKIPAGDYVVSNTITLPPYVAIVGDGVENTVIRKSTAGPVFKTVSRQSAIGAPVTFDENTTEANQSNNVSLSNLAIQCASDTAIDLYASRDCEFSNLKITGAWAHSDAYDNNNCGIRMHGNANVTTHNNKFTNIRFENVSFGVYSDFNATSNSIDGCSFYENYIGVAFGWGFNIDIGPLAIFGSPGQTVGPSYNTIIHNEFDMIAHEGVFYERGNDNRSSHNNFLAVGYPLDGAGPNVDKLAPMTAMIKIGDSTKGNKSIDDFFSRTREYALEGTYFNTPYIPEIEGRHETQFGHDRVSLAPSGTPTVILQIPSDRPKRVQIDYMYTNPFESIVQVGTLLVLIDPNSVGQPTNVTNEYDYSGPAAFNKSLQFTSELFNIDNTNLTFETLGVKVVNSIPSTGELQFSVKTIG
jgi:hypothetical protein